MRRSHNPRFLQLVHDAAGTIITDGKLTLNERCGTLLVNNNETGCILFDNADDISAGSKVARTGKTAGVPVGDAFLGRVVDALGRPIDGGDAIPADGCPSTLCSRLAAVSAN